MNKMRVLADKKMGKALNTFVTAVDEINQAIAIKQQMEKQVEQDIVSMEKAVISIHAGIDEKQALLLSLRNEIKANKVTASRIQGLTSEEV